MKGQLSVEFLLSFLITFLASAIIMGSLISISLKKEAPNNALWFAKGMSCYGFSGANIKEGVLCIEGKCGEYGNLEKTTAECQKSSLLD
ncbi:MAG: hypothetical protein D6769_00840 [Methanobacteriota archaeon]|nr:MAG: hypothetical protein D6769_00840 [Euryarchaeota archaeon]